MLQTATSEKKRRGTEDVTPWMNGWIHRLKLEKEAGQAPPAAGPLGYGDATSCFIMSEAVAWTGAIGAVRHGAECARRATSPAHLHLPNHTTPTRHTPMAAPVR